MQAKDKVNLLIEEHGTEKALSLSTNVLEIMEEDKVARNDAAWIFWHEIREILKARMWIINRKFNH